MTILPVVDRELRVVSRRPATYWARSVAAAVALSIAVWWYWVNASGRGSLNSLGEQLFWMLAGFTMGYAIFAGITYSSDSVSEEKREGTLGLLFLTDLRGY
ncbi:MAG: ABC transporter permease, partial [Pedosphaera sp.]|nr:ABC transporter permease [Pedosphaera sp.]